MAECRPDVTVHPKCVHEGHPINTNNIDRSSPMGCREILQRAFWEGVHWSSSLRALGNRVDLVSTQASSSSGRASVSKTEGSWSESTGACNKTFFAVLLVCEVEVPRTEVGIWRQRQGPLLASPPAVILTSDAGDTKCVCAAQQLGSTHCGLHHPKQAQLSLVAYTARRSSPSGVTSGER